MSRRTDDIQAAEAALGVRFRDPELLRHALTHSSHAAEHGRSHAASNERLEYLGDAVLKTVVAEELLVTLKDADEGRLSKISAQVVSGKALARTAMDMGLNDRMLLGHGEESSGGRTRVRNLAGLMEAVIGAVYLDLGFDAARSFVSRVMAPVMRDAISGPATDFKTALQEAVQGGPLGDIAYRIVKAEGPPHMPSFTAEVLIGGDVAGAGEGRSKRAAEQEAAKQALNSISNG